MPKCNSSFYSSFEDVAQRIEETEVELKHPEIEFDPSSVIVCLFD